MRLIRVISGDVPSSNPTRPLSTIEGDCDKHNKPRLRREIILSSLREKCLPYDVVSFATPTVQGECNLVNLYREVHDEALLNFLTGAWSKWKAMGPKWDEDNCLGGKTEKNETNAPTAAVPPPPLIPCHSAFRDGIEVPSSNVMGAMGYYCTDFITPIVGTLVEELEEDAAIICSAVDNACFGRFRVVYAVMTHPGHHACRDRFGGYCYLNNAALCARLFQRYLRTGKKIISNGKINQEKDSDDKEKATTNNCRVAILDIDYHCGNGTASIFYEDPTVFFTSIHCDPNIEYPWNAGHADQVGAGKGIGTTLHIPLAPGATWEMQYKAALEKAMSAIVEFDPAAFVVSLGLDTYEGDAVAVNRGGFKLKGGDYYAMGSCMREYMADMNIPCVFVQEGGYKMDTVGDAAADLVRGFAGVGCSTAKINTPGISFWG